MKKNLHTLCLALFSLFFLANCAAMKGLGPISKDASPPAYPLMAEDTDSGWWHARYRFSWPAGKEPSWHLDALAANEIIKPTLERHRKEILLWRFHRRASRDAAGHQLSFIFFTSSSKAQQVFDDLDSREVLERLESNGDLVLTRYDEVQKNKKPGVEDTSDPHWPLDLQKVWPWFIMGVSETWLGLIAQKAEKLPLKANDSNMEELKGAYVTIHDQVSERWRNHGAHAFVHHLNALFGYEPFQVNPDTLLRF